MEEKHEHLCKVKFYTGILESLGISAACEGVFKYSKYRELSDENGRPSWESAHACLGSHRL